MSNNRLILIVDDEEASLDMISAVLLSENYRVIRTSSAKSALEFVEENKLTLSAIIMDLVMPGYSGVVAIKTIKSQRLTRLIPIMALTASTDKDSVVVALEAGADDYLTKPFNPTELLARVKALCRISDFIKKWNAFAK